MRVFNAYVTEFVQVGIVGDLFHYQVTLHPWVWLLTRTSDWRNRKGVKSGRYAHTDYDFKKPKTDLLSVAHAPQPTPTPTSRSSTTRAPTSCTATAIGR
jgi:uncharacterized protein involved in type VI secretion and phage assembly